MSIDDILSIEIINVSFVITKQNHVCRWLEHNLSVTTPWCLSCWTWCQLSNTLWSNHSQNSIGLVLLRFGNPYTKRKLDKSIKKISQLSHKSPAMFSVNSLAYWVSASTSHIARELWLHDCNGHNMWLISIVYCMQL